MEKSPTSMPLSSSALLSQKTTTPPTAPLTSTAPHPRSLPTLSFLQCPPSYSEFLFHVNTPGLSSAIKLGTL